MIFASDGHVLCERNTPLLLDELCRFKPVVEVFLDFTKSLCDEFFFVNGLLSKVFVLAFILSSNSVITVFLHFIVFLFKLNSRSRHDFLFFFLRFGAFNDVSRFLTHFSVLFILKV
jgi:hypothetical protein